MKRSSYLELAAFGVGGLYILAFVLAAITRLVYPYELEWNEGAVLDHAIRLLEGKPLYTAPSLDFAPFVYTPLYYCAVALVMKIGGIGLWAGRLVSILATLGTALVIGAITRKETQSMFLALSSAMLYLAFYHATGFFFDIVRMDALAVLLGVAGIYSALYLKRGFLISAVLITLAYFTKQQMIVFWPAIAGWLLLHNRKEGLWFIFVSLILIVGTSIALNVGTHGWYSFYTMTIPSVKAHLLFSSSDAFNFLPFGMFGVFALTTVVIAIGTAINMKAAWMKKDNALLLYFCYLCAIVGGCMSLGNSGGYKNVLMPLAAIIATLFPICAYQLSSRLRQHIAQIDFVPWLILFAYASLAYNPFGQLALFGSAKQRAGGDAFIAKLRDMPGDVWIPFHGYINRMAGTPTHIHFMAMNDVLLVGDSTSKRLQREIDSAYVSHRFARIILDENRVYPFNSIAHYTCATTILGTPNVFLSRIGDAPTRPQFVYLPTKSEP